MQNFAEELSYWYLRLNGFFPISNFVLHKSEDIDYTADEDILAIRPPFVYEKIGGQKTDWDDKLFAQLDRNFLVAIICQVKGGRTISSDEKNNLFCKNRLDACVKRFGLFESKEAEQIVEELTKMPVATRPCNKCQIAKLLISRQKNEVNCLGLSLEDVYNFIKTRIRKYHQKFSDRQFFNSPVLQTIIEGCEFEQRNNNCIRMKAKK